MNVGDVFNPDVITKPLDTQAFRLFASFVVNLSKAFQRDQTRMKSGRCRRLEPVVLPTREAYFAAMAASHLLAPTLL
jgi:hypothetical protein